MDNYNENLDKQEKANVEPENQQVTDNADVTADETGLKDNSSQQEKKNTELINEKKGKTKKPKKEKQKKTPAREALEWVQAIVIAVVLALVVRNFVFTVVKVDGQSMEPNLQHADRLIVWRLGYEPKQGDIVVLERPDGTYWIKRVIATEGQTVSVDYDENCVYVDGEKLDEPYLENLPEEMVDKGFDYPNGEKLKDGQVFVMGDNRNHSSDGRVIGPIHEESIIGKAVLRFFPFGKIKTY